MREVTHTHAHTHTRTHTRISTIIATLRHMTMLSAYLLALASPARCHPTLQLFGACSPFHLTDTSLFAPFSTCAISTSTFVLFHSCLVSAAFAHAVVSAQSPATSGIHRVQQFNLLLVDRYCAQRALSIASACPCSLMCAVVLHDLYTQDSREERESSVTLRFEIKYNHVFQL
jgi:hypothetical protein